MPEVPDLTRGIVRRVPPIGLLHRRDTGSAIKPRLAPHPRRRIISRHTDDSGDHAQVIEGGWGADYPSHSVFIGSLTCASFIPNSTSTFDDSEFCDLRSVGQVARAGALQATRVLRMADALPRPARVRRQPPARGGFSRPWCTPLTSSDQPSQPPCQGGAR